MTVAKIARTLPGIDELKRRCQSLAVLDAILCPEWEYRYFSFNAAWAPGEMLALMRNGEGDDWMICFTPQGALLKGYHHDAPMARDAPWPGVLDNVPAEFRDYLEDPAFSVRQTTFCLWRRPEDRWWQAGQVEFPDAPDPDGSELLLRFLDGDPRTYQSWGEEYFGARLDDDAIRHVYLGRRLTPQIVASLNREVTLEELREELREIGYPLTP